MARRRDAWREYAAGSEVGHFAEFCATHLVQSEDRWDGQPLELEPWQRRMLGEALAFDADGDAVWRSVVLLVPRKNGKTQALAALAIYRLLTGAGRPEILLAAASDKQAGRLFDAAARFVRRSEELSRLLRVRDHVGEIAREDGLGSIHRLSSDPSRLYGYSPTLVVCDELAWWTTPTLRRAFAALTSGGGARSAPAVWTISTAGEAATRHDSVLGRILDVALDSDDISREPGLTVCRMREARTLVYEFAAPTVDPHDTKAMMLANPASWISESYLRRQADDPELTDAQVLQLHGNVWAATESTWIGPEAWAARADLTRKLVPGEKVIIGFDGSARRDSTWLVACALEDGFLWPIGYWEKPDRSSDWRVPRGEVSDAVDAAMESLDVVELACDPFGWHSDIEEWHERYGDVVVDYPTNTPARMGPGCDRFRVAVLEGDLSHDGNGRLAAHVGHVVTKQTPHGHTIKKDHPDSPRKIDGAVAAVIAWDRRCWHVGNPPLTPMFAFV